MHLSWVALLSIGLGGAAGAIARYALTVLLLRSSAASIPLGTLASNLLGCFIMGMLVQLAATSSWFNEAGLFPDHYRLVFAVGFCGSFTTMSALIFELSDLIDSGHLAIMAVYLTGTVVGGFLCLYLGMLLVRAFLAT